MSKIIFRREVNEFVTPKPPECINSKMRSHDGKYVCRELLKMLDHIILSLSFSTRVLFLQYLFIIAISPKAILIPINMKNIDPYPVMRSYRNWAEENRFSLSHICTSSYLRALKNATFFKIVSNSNEFAGISKFLRLVVFDTS